MSRHRRASEAISNLQTLYATRARIFRAKKFAAPVKSEANGLKVGEQPHLLTRNRGREPPSPARSTPGRNGRTGMSIRRLNNYPLKKTFTRSRQSCFGSRQGLKDFTETTTIIRVIFFVTQCRREGCASCIGLAGQIYF